MKLNKFESLVLCKIDKSYEQFLNQNGCITVKLNRALYGCIESARLWYDKLSGELIQLGYEKNPVDMCVFNRVEPDGSQTTIALHVDDMFITAKCESTLTRVIDELGKGYSELSVHRGRVIDYLGMTFDFTVKGKCKVTMNGFIHDLLSLCNHIEGESLYPANGNLFKVDSKSVQLHAIEKKFFHTITCKLLYLSKRVRPDILTAISFLTKRVNYPNEQDMEKLKKVIRYLRGSTGLGILLEGGKNLGVYAYVDASYGVHMDMKSHTGCVIGIGKGPVYTKSSGQKLNSKSSSEAELIGLSDCSNQIIWTRNFLIGQGYDIGPATVYEDNKSTIAMVKNGKSNNERTRHIAVRFYFIADRVSSGEIKIEYMDTGSMIADNLKPLTGKLFIRMRALLLNMS